jgi:catechol 2,3-dioxygenase-like lactoylglutathione lyase family enzyme
VGSLDEPLVAEHVVEVPVTVDNPSHRSTEPVQVVEQFVGLAQVRPRVHNEQRVAAPNDADVQVEGPVAAPKAPITDLVPDHPREPPTSTDARHPVSRMRFRQPPTLDQVFLELVTIVVDDYDRAIDFFVDTLGFELVEDTPATTNDGRPKRWVVVRPPGAQTGILLARADDRQRPAVGNQVAGRVGFFLRVDDFDRTFERLTSTGVKFVTSPRDEPYGRFALFLDIAGNRWDLLGPRPTDRG